MKTPIAIHLPNNRTLCVAALMAAIIAGMPPPAHATEGALGRPVAGTGLQSGAGMVPDVPIWAVNLTSIYFDGSIKGDRKVPIAGDVSLNVDGKVSMTLLTAMKVWNTGPGPWSFASTFSLPYLWNQSTADLTALSHDLRKRESDAGLFDLNFTPLVAGYHFSKNEHAAVGLSIWAPTGSYDSRRLANTGLHYWTLIPNVAYTITRPAEGIEFSAAMGVQFNTRNNATGYHSAPLLTADALATKQIGGGFGAGLVAGWVRQLGSDTGEIADKLNGFSGYSLAAGPIGTYSTMIGGKLPFQATLRWTPSLASRNRLEGNAFMLTVAMPL